MSPGPNPPFTCLWAQVLPLDCMSAAAMPCVQLHWKIVPEVKPVVCLAFENWSVSFQKVMHCILSGFDSAHDFEH